MSIETINKGKKEKESCDICCEYYSFNTRRKIECPKCKHLCCKKCMEKYLLENDKDIPTCMKCSLEFSTSFVFENTSKVFYIDRYLNKKAIKTLNEQKNLLPSTLITYNRKKEIKKRQEEINIQIRKYNRAVSSLKDELFALGNELNFPKNNEENKIHRPCPVNDCKGYLSTAWKCELCETWVCPDCGNKKEGRRAVDETHVCNEDDKQTLLLLKKDTKPCPGCYKPIHKIEGCDQMFCVECHTAFSWITGKKVNGIIHNPHYYELQRRQNGGIAPRVIGDNLCGINENEYPPLYLLRNVMYETRNEDIYYYGELSDIEKIHRACIHNDETLRHITINTNTRDDLYRKYRERYLEKSKEEYDEKKWTSDVKASIKKTEKNKQAKMIYDLVKTVSIDIFYKFINKEIEEYNCLIELYNIKEYANEELDKICENYGNKVYKYKSDYTLS